MNNSFQKSRGRLIALITTFLICLNLSGICQNATLTGKIPEYQIPLIVRDLKVCEQVVKQRDVLLTYNNDLKVQAVQSADTIRTERKDKVKYKTRSQKRGKTILYLIGSNLVEIIIIILIAR
jgi:hypothetical protein